MDDPTQNSLLLGRFQQLPFPQNSENTSLGVSSIHLPEDTTPSNSSDRDHDRDRSVPQPSTTLRTRPTCAAGGAFGGSTERQRTRLGVRFDLDPGVFTQATPHSRQMSMQLYRDLAGNLKKVRLQSFKNHFFDEKALEYTSADCVGMI